MHPRSGSGTHGHMYSRCSWYCEEFHARIDAQIDIQIDVLGPNLRDRRSMRQSHAVLWIGKGRWDRVWPEDHGKRE